MTTIFKGYLLIIGSVAIVMGLIGMFVADFTWYPAFEDIERGTSAANFIGQCQEFSLPLVIFL